MTSPRIDFCEQTNPKVLREMRRSEFHGAARVQPGEHQLARTHAQYVATCGARSLADLSASERDASLWGRLQAGAVPDWLEPLQMPGPFAVYRVK